MMAAFYAAAFLVNGLVIPFFPVLLAGRGLTGAEIALVLAVPHLGRLVSMPILAALADRFDRRHVATGVTFLMLVTGLALGPLDGGLALMAVSAALLLLNTTVGPLADAIALAMERRGLGDYGRMRLWGSASFILGNLFGGWLLDRHGDPAVYLATIAGFVLALAACVLVPRADPVPRTADLAALGVVRRPAFLAVLLAGAMIQAGHATLYGFATLTWQARGFEEVVIGAFWAVGVVAEIALFALAARFPARFSPVALLAMAGVIGAVRWALFAVDLGTVATGLVQAMHAGSFALGHLAIMRFLRERVPEERSASAQGAYQMLVGVSMAAAVALAGALWTRIGDDAFLAMTAFSLVGLAILGLNRPGLDRLPGAARPAGA